MRVLFWSETFWPEIGSAAIFAAGLLPRLLENGHEFAVIAGLNRPEGEDCEAWHDIPVYRFPFREALHSGSLDEMLSIRAGIKEVKEAFKPDLVHINALSPSLLFHYETSPRKQCPELLTVHGAPADQQDVHEGLKCKGLMEADWITCCSEEARSETLAYVPGVASRTSVAYCGIDESGWHPSTRPSEHKTILCVGRMTPEKGFDLAVEVFSKIHAEEPRARLVFAGDGPERGAVEACCRSLGLEDAVTFHGWVHPDQIRNLMDEAIAVLVSSREEDLPHAAIQGALMARPVVSTNVGGMSEIVADEETGFLVSPGDVSELASAILYILHHPDMTDQMGFTGRRHAREIFTLAKSAEAYVRLYRMLVKKKDRLHARVF